MRSLGFHLEIGSEKESNPPVAFLRDLYTWKRATIKDMGRRNLISEAEIVEEKGDGAQRQII